MAAPAPAPARSWPYDWKKKKRKKKKKKKKRRKRKRKKKKERKKERKKEKKKKRRSEDIGRAVQTAPGIWPTRLVISWLPPTAIVVARPLAIPCPSPASPLPVPCPSPSAQGSAPFGGLTSRLPRGPRGPRGPLSIKLTPSMHFSSSPANPTSRLLSLLCHKCYQGVQPWPTCLSALAVRLMLNAHSTRTICKSPAIHASIHRPLFIGLFRHGAELSIIASTRLHIQHSCVNTPVTPLVGLTSHGF
ncbi:hypothetical protein K504DRAFT_494750 [Pleomassaria siparia CBS 279.74]|uniref:Uncharacterized protein n=1 Tax=Pleomassaria siparia CBS 279.74 TaxID=1314801 RepID=A0A6G1JV42_9PLEO|nr:hypothetical protein K504DRAFT_494750 [Pleomassaria siparia CBS 279.74]